MRKAMPPKPRVRMTFLSEDTMNKQALINHVALLLDASSSMSPHSQTVVEVADALVRELATKSQELDQETRISVYTFNDYKFDNIFYDKDVLRLPSLKGRYIARGCTPLIASTTNVIADLEKTATLYGDHAFLLYVLTDGQETQYSHHNGGSGRIAELRERIRRLPENWTLATFVPDREAVRAAEAFGFEGGNIALWNPTGKMEEVGRKITDTTRSFMTQRSLGVRGSRSIFVDAEKLTDTAVKSLDSLRPGQYRIAVVCAEDCNTRMATANNKRVVEIQPFIEKITKRPYQLGEAFYQLIKSEEVQDSKEVLIQDRKSLVLYGGADARRLLGLPKVGDVRLRPTEHPKYDIYVQSTSVNRKLLEGQKVLVLSVKAVGVHV